MINSIIADVPVYQINHQQNTKNDELPNKFNAFGEAALQNAPTICLKNGKIAVPQQFLHYQRTRKNVENIISKIRFSINFPLFVHEENNCLFLQVGIVGHENYTTDTAIQVRPKIVYGRRWYIEPHTPTSEVVQTAYLAIQKAREHELREYVRLSVTVDKKTHLTTPFNTHMDLPLMAKNAELFSKTDDFAQPTSKSISEKPTPQSASQAMPVHAPREMQSKFNQSNTAQDTQNAFTTAVSNCLKQVSFGELKFRVSRVMALDEQTWLFVVNSVGTEAAYEAMRAYFPEQVDTTYPLIIKQTAINQTINDTSLSNISNGDQEMSVDSVDSQAAIILHKLMQAMIDKSNDYVSQNFYFDEFARFDNRISPIEVAKFSLNTRKIAKNQQSEQFKQQFKRMVATVDSKKAPMYAQNLSLYQLQRQAVAKHTVLDGYLPYYVDSTSCNEINTGIDGMIRFNQQPIDFGSLGQKTDLNLPENISEIIAMAWCDKTSFEDIKQHTGLNEQEVIGLMRQHLKRSSFKLWRKRVSGRVKKHRGKHMAKWLSDKKSDNKKRLDAI